VHQSLGESSTRAPIHREHQRQRAVQIQRALLRQVQKVQQLVLQVRLPLDVLFRYQ
jgi:hypothetical protein